MQDDFLQVSISEHIAEVKLNRPEKANSIVSQGFYDLKRVFDELDTNDDVRVIILSGNGKHFCAGIDVDVLLGLNKLVAENCEGRKREKIRQLVLELQAPINALEDCRKPVLAAIHGVCIGAGLHLVAAADMRYCVQNTQFSIKEIDLGIVADLGVLQRLPKLISPGMVNEMAFTGRMVDGLEAKKIGLVNQSFESYDSMYEYVRSIAQTIAKKSPLSIRGTKEVVKYAREHNTRDSLQQIAIWNAAMLLSEDFYLAGKAAFSGTDPEFRN